MTLICLPSRNYHGQKDYTDDAERRFAALLDANGIRYEYEPHFFVEEVEAATPTWGFSPDFWLPELHIYVEIYWHADDGKPTSAGRRRTVKRGKIRRLSEATGLAVVLLHRENWPEPCDDWQVVADLIPEARQKAAAAFDKVP